MVRRAAWLRALGEVDGGAATIVPTPAVTAHSESDSISANVVETEMPPPEAAAAAVAAAEFKALAPFSAWKAEGRSERALIQSSAPSRGSCRCRIARGGSQSHAPRVAADRPLPNSRLDRRQGWISAQRSIRVKRTKLITTEFVKICLLKFTYCLCIVLFTVFVSFANLLPFFDYNPA